MSNDLEYCVVFYDKEFNRLNCLLTVEEFIKVNLKYYNAITEVYSVTIIPNTPKRLSIKERDVFCEKEINKVKETLMTYGRDK